MRTEKNGLGNIESTFSSFGYKNKFKIPLYKPLLNGNELRYVSQCITTNWVSSQGSFVEKFEKNFSKYVGTKYASSTCNGTTALYLSLLALGIGKGDEVIVPDLTFVSTATSVIHAGAKPVFADIDEKTLNIDPQDIRKKITKKTKAIIPVHLYGRPAQMKEIIELAQEYDLKVIEDSAESHGAKIGNKKAGSFADLGIFSFYGNKIMTTGEGGMVVSNNEELIAKVNLLKNHGMKPNNKYWHEVVGYNYRMTNIQAALGLAQLEKIEEKISLKRKIANNYKKLFSETNLTLPSEDKGTKNVYWLYWVMLKNKNALELIKKLAFSGIETRTFFYPLSSMPIFGKQKKQVNSHKVFQKGLCLPSFPSITYEEQQEVASKIIGLINQS
ncbi:MAG: DegT/DnrJ/EryC1/StrS family aminotransferase [Candidatus Diapherotrites archaeon]